MNILGVSFFYHDSAASLVCDNKLVCAAEEERFTRLKHDFSFPNNAIKFCLNFSKESIQNIDYVVFNEKPRVKLNRIIYSLKNNFNKNSTIREKVYKKWGEEKIWIKELISKKLNISERKILFSEHHLSHAASSFYVSPFESASIVTADAVGEWVTSTSGNSEEGFINRDSEILFPNSLGLFYSAMTSFLGFSVNDGEYKVMGMAPYGRPLYVEKILKLFKTLRDDYFELDMSYFDFEYSMERMYSNKFIELFGEPRKKDDEFLLDNFHFIDQNNKNGTNSNFLKKNQYYSDLASSIQKVTEDILINYCKSNFKKNKHQKNLCLAGGVFYNSVANTKILEKSGFRNIYIPPATGDNGASYGAAFAVNRTFCGKKSFVLKDAYLGNKYSSQEIRIAIKNKNLNYYEFKNENEVLEKAVNLLADNKVIGWFQNRSEMGPRALGNRSILADPRKFKMRNIVNERIKFRELFRPFAPATIKEKAKIYFNFPHDDVDQLIYNFMLGVVQVNEKSVDNLQATTHFDNSARVQIVEKHTNSLFYNLIKGFGELTGTYVILNTSFNRRGEPIVEKPKDAINTFLWSNLDALFMENFFITK